MEKASKWPTDLTALEKSSKELEQSLGWGFKNEKGKWGKINVGDLEEEKKRRWGYRFAEMVVSATTKIYWLLLGKEPEGDYWWLDACADRVAPFSLAFSALILVTSWINLNKKFVRKFQHFLLLYCNAYSRSFSVRHISSIPPFRKLFNL